MLIAKTAELSWPERITVLKNPLNFFRLIFGVYFFIMNVKLLIATPYLLGAETLVKNLLIDSYKTSLLQFIFNMPDLIFIILMGLNLIWAILIITLRHHRLGMLCSWICLSLIFVRIPSVRSIHIDYLGWLMLLNLFVDDDKIPTKVAWASWIFFAGTYFLSGLGKVRVPEWNQGNALYYVLQTSIVRESFLLNFILDFKMLAKLLNYLVIALELGAIALIWNTKSRWVLLFASALMHLSIMSLLKISDLTIVILIFHLFLLATIWHPVANNSNESII